MVLSKPQLIQDSQNIMWLSDAEYTVDLLEAYQFSADRYLEDDGSVTLGLNEIDLVENGSDEEMARTNMGQGILEYAKHYYEDFDIFFHAPNRKGHLPYVIKALTINDPKRLGRLIICRDGKN